MRRVSFFVLACSLVLAVTDFAHAATYVYEGQISHLTQDPWTLTPGNALPENYVARFTIQLPSAVTLNVRKHYDRGNDYSCSNDRGEMRDGGMDVNCCCCDRDRGDRDERATIPMWVTTETANLGVITAEVWQQMPNGALKQIGITTSPVRALRYDFGKNFEVTSGAKKFHADAEIDMMLPGLGQLQVFNFFGDPVPFTLMTAGSNVKMSRDVPAQQMHPFWQVLGPNNSAFYAGTLRLMQSR